MVARILLMHRVAWRLIKSAKAQICSMFLGTGNDLVIDYDQGKDKSLKKTTSKGKT